MKISMNKKVLISSFSVLILILCVGIFVFFNRGDKESNPAGQDHEVETEEDELPIMSPEEDEIDGESSDRQGDERDSKADPLGTNADVGKKEDSQNDESQNTAQEGSETKDSETEDTENTKQSTNMELPFVPAE